MNLRKFAAAAILAGGLLLAGTTQAAVITLDFQGFQNGSKTGTITAMGTTVSNTQAGLFVFNVTNVSGDPEINLYSKLVAFCLEANVLLQDPASYELLSAGDYFNDAARMARIEQLFSQFLGSIGTATTDAAFQLALWEIIYDSDLNLEAGDFVASSFGGARAVAQGWLDSLGTGGSASLWALRAPGDGVSNVSQDLITWVPEPGTLALLGLGLIGFGAMRRRAKA
jgi:hypothetical protein